MSQYRILLLLRFSLASLKTYSCKAQELQSTPCVDFQTQLPVLVSFGQNETHVGVLDRKVVEFDGSLAVARNASKALAGARRDQ